MRSMFMVLALAGCGLSGPGGLTQAIPEQTIAAGGGAPSRLFAPVQVVVSPPPGSRAVLSSLVLTATPPGAPGGFFDFVDSARAFMSAPGQPTVEVARVEMVPRGATTLTLAVAPGVDVGPLLAAGATLTSTATGRAPAMDFTFAGTLELQVSE